MTHATNDADRSGIRLTRRRLLGGAVSLAGLGLLAACGGSAPTPTAAPAARATDTPRPAGTTAAAAAPTTGAGAASPAGRPAVGTPAAPAGASPAAPAGGAIPAGVQVGGELIIGSTGPEPD